MSRRPPCTLIGLMASAMATGSPMAGMASTSDESEAVTACAQAAEEALFAGQTADAIALYTHAADDPRCVGERVTHLRTAALLARQAAESGTAADKCALVSRFEALLAAAPPPEVGIEARAERNRASTYCEATATDAAAERARLIERARPAEPPPPFATREAVPAPTRSYVAFGVSGLAFLGAGVAVVMLGDATDERAAAQASVGPGTSTAARSDARARFETANVRAQAAGVSAIGLATVGVIAGTIGLIGLWRDDGAATPAGRAREGSTPEPAWVATLAEAEREP